MSIESIYKVLTTVFHEVLEDESIVLVPELSANDVSSWDSLNHIRLIISVEEAFSIKFSTLEVTELKKVSDLVDLILVKLKSFESVAV
ncbi:MAG: acyl carrier protein [Gammaproteobacteria bacterium]